jgi:hypothetical protein
MRRRCLYIAAMSLFRRKEFGMHKDGKDENDS